METSNEKPKLENIHEQIQDMAGLFDTIIASQKVVEAPEQNSALKQLWTFINQESMEVSISATETIVQLVKLGFVSPVYAMQNFIADSSSARFPAAVLQGVTEVMLLICDASSEDFLVSPFQAPPLKPTHPYILLLSRRKEHSAALIQECNYILYHRNDRIRNSALHLLEPFIFYCFCLSENFQLIGLPLLETMFTSALPRENLVDLFCKITILMKHDSCSYLEQKIDVLMALAKTSIELSLDQLSSALLPCLLMSIRYAIRTGAPTRMLLSYAAAICTRKKKGCDVAMCALSDAISSVGGNMQVALLTIGLSLVMKKDGNTIVSGRLLPTLLQILSRPNHYVKDLRSVSGKLACVIQSTPCQVSMSTNLSGNRYWNVLSSTYPELKAYEVLVETCDEIVKNPDFSITWLDTLSSGDLEAYSFYHSTLSSIVLYQESPSHSVQEVLKIFEKAVQMNPNLGVEIFTMLLSRLSKESDPTTQLKILHTMCRIALDKKTVSMIMKTLLSLWRYRELRHIVLRLMFYLWKQESRVYSQLVTLISDESYSTEKLDATRAFVITSICKEKPSQHGEDLLPLLSGLLKENQGRDNTTQISIALDGIEALCAASVIDLRTVWQVIGPKLEKDQRPEVIVKLCQLLSVTPSMEVRSENYELFTLKSVALLWEWTASPYRTDVHEAAFKSLQIFEPSYFKIKMLPSYVRDKYSSLEDVDEASECEENGSEQIAGTVPPEAWIELICGCSESQLQYVEHFYKRLIEREVSSLPRGIYLTAIQEAKKRGIKSSRFGPEPPNYDFLPSTSIMRAAVNFLLNFPKKLNQCNAQKLETDSLLQCVSVILNSLGQPLNRPFPALNWSFLDEVNNAASKLSINGTSYWSTRIRHGVIKVTAQQCNKSTSASSIISKYLSSSKSLKFSDKEEIFDVLDQLGRGLDAGILQQFLTNILDPHNADVKETTMMLTKFKSHLHSDIVLNTNRKVFTNVIEKLADKINESHESLYAAYVSCVAQLPQKSIDKLTLPSSWDEVTDSKLYFATRLRYQVANSQNGLLGLSDTLKAIANLSGDRSHFLKIIAQLLLIKYDSKQCFEWILRLLTVLREHLSQDLRGNQGSIQEQTGSVIFYFDLIVMSLVIWSGAYALSTIDRISSVTSVRNRLLCPSITALYSRKHWGKTLQQLLNWLVLTYHQLAPFVVGKYDLESALLTLATCDDQLQLNFWSKIVTILWQSHSKIPVVA